MVILAAAPANSQRTNSSHLRLATCVLLAMIALAGCATQQTWSKLSPARAGLIAARKSNDTKIAAAYYMDAADNAARAMNGASGADLEEARDLFNTACGELTVLLRSSKDLWNHTETLTIPGGASYVLHFAPPRQDVWAPGYFDTFHIANTLDKKLAKERNRVGDYGGMLVGIYKPADPRKYFYPIVGVAAPVTATLDFQPHVSGAVANVTLTFYDPARQDSFVVNGKKRALAADFTAPVAYYPDPKLIGLEGMLRPGKYIKKAGIYLLQPYDPTRIPVLFVHGLSSSPQTWGAMINAVESDPELHGRYQFWVFGYPSGDPIAYSALQLRDSLREIYQFYPKTRDMMVIGHSLGGILAQMQAVNTGRAIWDGVFPKNSAAFYAQVPADDVVKQALVFNENPRIERIIFISTPHRGSDLATDFIGRVGVRLIELPGSVVKQTYEGLGAAAGHRMEDYHIPDSVQGLSPQSPMLKALNTLKIIPPFHSIMGDGGHTGGPVADSTDGVVAYWSSYMPGAQSNYIVPYGHGCLAEPKTIAEVKRILKLNLKSGPAAEGK